MKMMMVRLIVLFTFIEGYVTESSQYFAYFVDLARLSLDFGQLDVANKCFDMINDAWQLFRVFSATNNTEALQVLALRCKKSPDSYSVYLACTVLAGDVAEDNSAQSKKDHLKREELGVSLGNWALTVKESSERDFYLGRSIKGNMKFPSAFEPKPNEEPKEEDDADKEGIQWIDTNDLSKWLGAMPAEAVEEPAEDNGDAPVDNGFGAEFGAGAKDPSSKDAGDKDDKDTEDDATSTQTEKGDKPKPGLNVVIDMNKTFGTSANLTNLTFGLPPPPKKGAKTEDDELSHKSKDEESNTASQKDDGTKSTMTQGGNESDSDDEGNKHKIFRRIKISATKVTTVDASALDNAASSLSMGLGMPAAPTTSDNRRRRTATMSEPPKEVSLPLPPTPKDTPTTLPPVPNPSTVLPPVPKPTPSTPLPQPPSTLSPTPKDDQMDGPSSNKIAANVNPAESLKKAHAMLEKGRYSEAKKFVKEAVHALSKDTTQVLKKTNIVLCVRYRLLILLLAHVKKLETVGTFSSDIAPLTVMMSEIPDILPKHKIVCKNMAVKKNLDAKNYAVAAKYIKELLPMAPAQIKPDLESKLKTCEEAQFANANSNLNGTAPLKFCWRTFQLIQATDQAMECTYCDATFHPAANVKPFHKCKFCHYGEVRGN